MKKNSKVIISAAIFVALTNVAVYAQQPSSVIVRDTNGRTYVLKDISTSEESRKKESHFVRNTLIGSGIALVAYTAIRYFYPNATPVVAIDGYLRNTKDLATARYSIVAKNATQLFNGYIKSATSSIASLKEKISFIGAKLFEKSRETVCSLTEKISFAINSLKEMKQSTEIASRRMNQSWLLDQNLISYAQKNTGTALFFDHKGEIVLSKNHTGL